MQLPKVVLPQGDVVTVREPWPQFPPNKRGNEKAHPAGVPAARDWRRPSIFTQATAVPGGGLASASPPARWCPAVLIGRCCGDTDASSALPVPYQGRCRPEGGWTPQETEAGRARSAQPSRGWWCRADRAGPSLTNSHSPGLMWLWSNCLTFSLESSLGNTRPPSTPGTGQGSCPSRIVSGRSFEPSAGQAGTPGGWDTPRADTPSTMDWRDTSM